MDNIKGVGDVKLSYREWIEDLIEDGYIKKFGHNQIRLTHLGKQLAIAMNGGDESNYDKTFDMDEYIEFLKKNEKKDLTF